MWKGETKTEIKDQKLFFWGAMIILFLAFCFVFFTRAGADNSTDNGTVTDTHYYDPGETPTVYGYIKDKKSGKLVPGVKVQLKMVTCSGEVFVGETATNLEGGYVFYNLKMDKVYAVTCPADGLSYDPKTTPKKILIFNKIKGK